MKNLISSNLLLRVFSRRIFLFLSWLFLVLAALNLNADIPRPSHSFLVVVDVTLSMNTKDVLIDSDPKSRINYIQEALEDVVRFLPCGTKIGVGIFAGYQTSILFNPVEICDNYTDLLRSFGFLETNMIWAGDSEVSKGLYNSIKIIDKLDPNIRLVFITDGHEAPPIAPAYRPSFNGQKNKVKGLLVGVGSLKQSKIPKINSEGQEAGFWKKDEVMQYDPFSLGRKGSDENEQLIDNESANVDPGIVEQIQATPGKEHLTQLRQKYLNLLAREINFKYLRLINGEKLANDMYGVKFSEWRAVNTPLSGWFAAVSFVFLLVAFFPRMLQLRKLLM